MDSDDKPLATLAEAEEKIDAPEVTQAESPEEKTAEVDLAEIDKPLSTEVDANLAADLDARPADPTREQFEGITDEAPVDSEYSRAKALLEGQTAPMAMEIPVSGNDLYKLPISPVAIDAHGRLWAVEHDKGVLRFVGKVVR